VGEWTPESVRCGAIGRKIGQMSVWDARGVKTLCTVVKVDNCQVLQVRKFLSGRGHPRVNLQLGAVPAEAKDLKKGPLVEFRKRGVDPKKRCVTSL
jgi:ribosomal protein L3